MNWLFFFELNSKQREVIFIEEDSNLTTNGYFDGTSKERKYELKCPVTFYSGNNTKCFREQSKFCHLSSL